MKGKISSIGEIIQVSQGVKKDGKPWTLWSAGIVIDGQEYSFTNFSKTSLEADLTGLGEQAVVDFEFEQKGKFKNFKLIKLSEDQNYVPEAEKDLKQDWKACFNFVVNTVKEKFPDAKYEEIGPSVNTLFMQERRK